MKLSKDKRNQLILVIFCTMAVVALMWFDLIRPRYTALSQAATSQKAAGQKLEDIQSAIKRANTITTDLADVTQTLSNAENDMASGDLYSWIYDTIRLFKTTYQVDIPQIGPPEVETVNLLPSYPFKQVKFTITGTAYYHDFGKFIANFENTFPHIRVVNLQIQPNQNTGSNEKLSFKIDVIALVKSSTSP